MYSVRVRMRVGGKDCGRMVNSCVQVILVNVSANSYGASKLGKLRIAFNLIMCRLHVAWLSLISQLRIALHCRCLQSGTDFQIFILNEAHIYGHG